ncbi:MAG TPA: hypothetical protein VFN31_01400 [Candidatus Saccharimonadales bacterium]|nr:hypothetical protein [Candidatus Saccharimonadales bacterium]
MITQEISDVENGTLATLEDNITASRMAEIAVYTHFHTYLGERTLSNMATFRDATISAGSRFDSVVDQVLSHADYTGTEKSLQLRTIYEDLIDFRKDRIDEKFQNIDSASILRHFTMDAFFGYYINTKPVVEGVRDIKARYRYELDRGFDVMKAITDATLVVNHRTLADYYTSPESGRVVPLKTAISLAGAALLGVGVGLMLNSKPKSR